MILKINLNPNYYSMGYQYPAHFSRLTQLSNQLYESFIIQHSSSSLEVYTILAIKMLKRHMISPI